jgi:DNA-binding NtrC family response regulator
MEKRMQYTILVVDDEPSIRDLLQEALTTDHHRVIVSPSAEQALPILDRETVDVVVSDEKLTGGMSGADLLARVRKRHPETIRMMLSGQATLETAIQAINEGQIFRFFTKPCNLTDLKISIRQALDQRELVRENLRLRKTIQEQKASLEQLEQLCPGITEVKRDVDGVILLDDED